MPKKKLPELYRRKWLNKDEGTAYINTNAKVNASFDDSYPEDRSVDAGFELKDCYRQCAIELYYHNDKTYERMKNKLRLIIEELEQLEQFMLDNPPVYSKRKKKSKEGSSNTGTILEASAVVHPAGANDEETGSKEA